MSETVTIPKEEYKKLLEAEAFLDSLIAAGVDNWPGYGEAQDTFSEWKEQQ